MNARTRDHCRARPGPLRGDALARIYVGLIVTIGLFIWLLLAHAGLHVARQAPPAFWLLAGLLVATEFLSVDVEWHGKALCATLSSPVALAMLNRWGLPVTGVTVAVASLLEDAANRSAPRKLLFNVAHNTLALTAAFAIYAVLAGTSGPIASWRGAAAFCAAAFAMQAVSEVTVRVAVSLDPQTPQAGPQVGTLLKNSAAVSGVTAALNVGLTLVMLVAVPNPTVLSVALAAPILATHFAFQLAAQAQTARRQAEAAQASAEAALTDAEAARDTAKAQAAETARALQLAQDLVQHLRAQQRHTLEALAIIGLEVREPLAGIQSIAATLLQGPGLPPATRTDLLAAILEQVDTADAKAARLLLDVQQHRTQPTVSLAADMTDAVEAARHAAQLAAFLHGIDPQLVKVCAPPRLLVHATAETLDWILAALIDNAIRHAPGKPIRLDVAERAEVELHGTQAASAMIAVTDQGPGVPPSEREQVFEPSARLRPPHDRHLGLSLHIARSLVRSQGGDLAVTDPAVTDPAVTDPAAGAPVVGAPAGARFELRLLVVATVDASRSEPRSTDAGPREH